MSFLQCSNSLMDFTKFFKFYITSNVTETPIDIMLELKCIITEIYKDKYVEKNENGAITTTKL